LEPVFTPRPASPPHQARPSAQGKEPVSGAAAGRGDERAPQQAGSGPAHRGAERRGSSAHTPGHVRLSTREVNLLSQMRTQYRKTFGVFFDPYEFTGNDLYARTT